MRIVGPSSPRRSSLLLATAVLVVLAGCDRPATREEPIASSPTPISEPTTPSFRFSVGDRDVVPTGRTHATKRQRRAALEAADRVRSLVTDLYAEAFLDSGNWTSGSYDGVFELFAGSARTEARRRTGVLTAGEEAGDRFDLIEPLSGQIVLRILLDRGGKPILVASSVRFRARGTGADPSEIRSDGSYLFRPMKGTWRIVSFGVERKDREGGAA